MQGVDDIHPLLLVDEYTQEMGQDNFFVTEFVLFAGYPLLQIKNFLIRLYNDGFIYYDFSSEN